MLYTRCARQAPPTGDSHAACPPPLVDKTRARGGRVVSGTESSARELRREIAPLVAVELPPLLADHAVPLNRVAAPEPRR